MRKLALLAIASLPLLGGCVSQVCDLPTASFSWSLQDTNGSSRNCGWAGVDIVDIYIGHGVSPITFNCTDYSRTVDVSGYAPGRYPTTVEGVDSTTGAIIVRAQFDVVVGDCGGTVYAPVLKEAMVRVDYHFGPPGADLCFGAGGSTDVIWFALWDEVASQYASVINTSSSSAWKIAYPCGSAIEFPLPVGSYRLLGVQEVVNPITNPTSVNETCGGELPVSVTFTAAGAVKYLTPAYLLPTNPLAPACYLGAAP
jgi:hypothetical protein